MRGLPIAVFFLTACNVYLLSPAHSQASDVDNRIANAVLPLPAPLQAGATVVAYDADMKQTILRRGTNDLICIADGPGSGFSVLCQHENVMAYWLRGVELVAGGASRQERDEIRNEEMEQGRLPAPEPGQARYGLAGRDAESATPIMVVMLPFATKETTGLSTEPNNYRPWLMQAGTVGAHIMIPGK